MNKPESGFYATVVPVNPYSPPTEPPPDPSQSLRIIFHAIWSRLWMVAVVAGACLILAVAYVRFATPLYTSVTEILIDPRSKELTGGEVMPSGLESGLGADTALVESQVAIVQSESVMAGLIRNLELDRDPEFIGASGGALDGVKSAVKSILYADADVFAATDYDKAKKKLGKRLEVGRKGSTYIIEIEASSESSEKAAEIANELARLYVSGTDEHAQASTLQASFEIDARLEDLKTAALFADKAVEDYRAENGLISADDVLVVEQRLSDTNELLSAAKTETQAARAKFEEIRALSRDPINARLNISQSLLSDTLLTRLADVSAQEATLSTQLLPSHPRLAALREQRRNIEATLAREMTAMLKRAEQEYNIANQREKALEEQISELQAASTRSKIDGVQLRELEREAELSREVYETFLARSKQVNEEVGLNSDNTRIISRAYASSVPSHPKASLLLPAALVAGVLLGVMLAWTLHVLNGTVIPFRQSFQAAE